MKMSKTQWTILITTTLTAFINIAEVIIKILN